MPDDLPLPIACYYRTSTEDQAERNTIDAQRDFLRAFAALYDLPVVGEYSDDGVSGAIPLAQRPAGRQLLQDAQARRFGVVLVYRVDRLGRSLTALLDAHTLLSPLKITIRSATEPFDTATPIGIFLFQLLGSMAELERATIRDRMSLGKARVARHGKWVGGIVPFGYDLTEEGQLTPSTRLVPPLGVTEADVAREVFTRMAQGSSGIAECRRLNALGILPTRHYGGAAQRSATAWSATRIWKMLHNPVYCGRHIYHSRHGAITREVPALVSVELWDRVQQQFVRNKSLPKANAQRTYLLSGLLQCGLCGLHFIGSIARKGRWEQIYYRCGALRRERKGVPRNPCLAKKVPAARLEAEVWAACRALILNPALALEETRQTSQRQALHPEHQLAARAQLEAALAQKGEERERVITMGRRGHITYEEFERQIDQILLESRALQEELDALHAQEALREANTQYMEGIETLLRSLQPKLDAAEAQGTLLQRRLLEILIHHVRIDTYGTGHNKRYGFHIEWNLASIGLQTS